MPLGKLTVLMAVTSPVINTSLTVYPNGLVIINTPLSADVKYACPKDGLGYSPMCCLSSGPTSLVVDSLIRYSADFDVKLEDCVESIFKRADVCVLSNQA
jgi:hypothetical protein